MKQIWKDRKGYSNLVPMVLAVTITFALLFIGGYVNGTIHDQLDSNIDNDDARATMNNTSDNWDATLNIVQVVIIITVLAAAIGAIFLFTRFR
jgi:hypothetical protein